MKNIIFSFKTLGCRLNQAEEESLRRELMETGFLISESKDADFLIVNSCSVTAVADRKTRQAIQKIKAQNPKLKIIVTGCGAEKAKGYCEVDLAIPNNKKKDALNLICDKFGLASKRLDLKPACRQGREAPRSDLKGSRTRALLKIQDGCNNFCAYCVVPYLRGREISIPVADVIAEAKKFERLGYKELVLTGVNAGRYQGKLQIPNNPGLSTARAGNYQTNSKFRIPETVIPAEAGIQIDFESRSGMTKYIDLTELIRSLLRETNFPRIRLSSINPQDVKDEMIDLWSKDTRLCRHFHLSLQSGSTNVLKRMGRPYTAQKYYSLVTKIVQKIPDVAITTDIIVGFPGETEKEFAETCDFVRKIGFAKLHVFRYSPRAGTRAEHMTNQVSEKVKTERSNKLIKIGEELRAFYIKRFVGRELEVLFEEKKPQKGSTLLGSKRVEPSGEDFWYGLTSNYIRVKYQTDKSLNNKIIRVKLNKRNLLN